ncbi:hypothetical protein MNB_SV-4-1294 [hydrothermal vent metagenome]|uniref:Uncharacterized protein n=1 Tax=hydrothermal vent metagenome TaxID=652676 RepID=A0A1W1E8C1_9ZZZZ
MGSANPDERVVSAFLSWLSFFYFGVIIIKLGRVWGVDK